MIFLILRSSTKHRTVDLLRSLHWAGLKVFKKGPKIASLMVNHVSSSSRANPFSWHSISSDSVRSTGSFYSAFRSHCASHATIWSVTFFDLQEVWTGLLHTPRRPWWREDVVAHYFWFRAWSDLDIRYYQACICRPGHLSIRSVEIDATARGRKEPGACSWGGQRMRSCFTYNVYTYYQGRSVQWKIGS